MKANGFPIFGIKRKTAALAGVLSIFIRGRKGKPKVILSRSRINRQKIENEAS